MGKKLSSAIGVDIGSQKIKIAEIKLAGKEPTISAVTMTDTPPGTVDHTGVYDVDAIGAAIKQALATSGATASHFVFSVAGQQSVLVRTLEVPRMNPNELKEHMNWEITRNIPFPESTVVSDFRSFEPADAASQNLDVVMAISPQSAVDTLIGIAKKAGKPIAAIDVEPLGIARSLKVSGSSDPNEVVCVVDVGHKTTSINMYRDGQLLLPRQVPIGGEMFTEAIANNLNLSVEEAEAMKVQHADIPESASMGMMSASFGAAPTQAFQAYNPFADDPALMNPALAPGGMAVPDVPLDPYAAPPVEAAGAFEPAEIPVPAAEPAAVPSVSSADSVRIYNAMAGVLDEFVAEVRRSVDYFRSKGGDVNRIVLCGGGARLRGLAPFLASSLGLPAAMHDPFQGLSISAKKLDQSLLEENAEAFAVAIGNGLHIAFE
ncbi:MAG: Cell division protein FtsA [Fimbriimonadaceae bacterium]|nr:Cell division protein FtsA [Fimbriimonadaceae bacterium]